MAEFNALIQTYTVDFASNNNFLFIPAIQSDGYGSRYVIINLVSNGQPFSVPKDSVRVLIEGQKTDGTQVMDYCEVMDDETSVKVNITPQMVASPGKNKFEIAIISLTENTVLTSFPLYIMASERAFDMDQAISSDDYQVFVKYINDMDATLSTIDEVEATCSSNEAVRQSNENKRVSAESARASAENTRKSNETNRSSAEADRIKAEVNRCNAEDNRILNEAARQTTEISRAETWSLLKSEVITATDAANQSAENIQTKAANGDFSAMVSNVTAITGAPGSLATVENIGTDQDVQLVFTIPKGDTGAPFSISKTYSSISEMEINYTTDGLNVGDLVIIDTGDVNNVDNAKV